MALMCAGVTIIVIALYSPFYFAIAGPDSRPTAVQSTLAVSLVAVLGGGPHAISMMMVALALSTALTGAALYMFGSLGMGRWIRYVPYPVISGFLASTGWVLTIGGVRVMLNLPLRWDTLAQLAQPLPQQRLIVGLAFTVVFCLVLFRSKHFLWLPSLLICGTLLTHVMLALRGISVAEAQAQGWLLLFSKGGGVWLPYHEFRELFSSWQPLKAAFLWAFGGGVLVLITVSAIGALVTAAAIELSTGTDADLDRELKAHGVANALSGLVGGLVGCNAIVRSALNRQAGAASRLSGVLAGVLFVAGSALAGLGGRAVPGHLLPVSAADGPYRPTGDGRDADVPGTAPAYRVGLEEPQEAGAQRVPAGAGHPGLDHAVRLRHRPLGWLGRLVHHLRHQLQPGQRDQERLYRR
jgi:SulP family sulfate permease